MAIERNEIFDQLGITQTNIDCSEGKSNQWISVPGLTGHDQEILNQIGCGTIKGYSEQAYLDFKKNGYTYIVEHISSSGDFTSWLRVTSVQTAIIDLVKDYKKSGRQQ